MAEWWVDPENGLTTNDGTSAETPWLLIPGQTGASAQTGYSVTAGDTVNVRNGTTTTLSIAAPADNLTYRGYGLADNVLYVPLPSFSGPVLTRVVRETAVHEGMWIVDADGASPFSVISSSTRSGCVFEDFHIIAPLASTPLSLGTSTSTAIGVTARRFKVSGAADTGISFYTRQALLEDFVVEEIEDDGITPGASASNGYRAGYRDVIRRFAVINPGLDNAAFIGDALQNNVSSGRYEAHLTIEDMYVFKGNNTKQGVVLTDMLAGFTLRRFYFDGPATATAQILLSGLRGRCHIGEGVFAGACASHPAIRFGTQSGVSMDTGSSLTVEAVMVTAPINNGLFNWAAAESASTVDGAVEIRGCYVGGEIQQDLSYSAAITAHPGGAVTFGGNQSLTARNNIIVSTGQHAFRLPSGAGGSGLYTFENNIVAPDLTFAIGSTEYADLAAFEAAHAAGDNQQVDPLLDASYRPLAASPCIGAGIYLPSARHYGGKRMSPVSPTIGAHGYYAARTVATDRTIAASRTIATDRRIALARAI